MAEVVDRHRGERARDPLADRDEHVQLPRLRPVGNLVCELEQVVGRAPHGGDDGDDAVTPSRAATSRRATALSFSGSATEVPPNFITTVSARARASASASTARNGFVLGHGHAKSV